MGITGSCVCFSPKFPDSRDEEKTKEKQSPSGNLDLLMSPVTYT